MEGADPTHESVTSHLKNALLAVGEVKATKKMGDEIREAAGPSTGSPNHN